MGNRQVPRESVRVRCCLAETASLSGFAAPHESGDTLTSEVLYQLSYVGGDGPV